VNANLACNGADAYFKRARLLSNAGRSPDMSSLSPFKSSELLDEEVSALGASDGWLAGGAGSTGWPWAFNPCAIELSIPLSISRGIPFCSLAISCTASAISQISSVHSSSGGIFHGSGADFFGVDCVVSLPLVSIDIGAGSPFDAFGFGVVAKVLSI